MKKHRGLIWALGLTALIGLQAQESRAAGITMTLTWSGGSLSFNSLTASPYVNSAQSSATSLVLNLNAVDGYLSGHGSNVTFTSLGAQSNFPGGNPIPTEATLSENGQAVLSGTTAGGASSIMVATNEAGFTTPSGSPGTLTSLPSLSFNNVATGSLTSSSSYNSTDTTAYTSTSTGPALNPGSPPSAPTTMGIPMIVSGYTLDNSATVDMTGSTAGTGTYTNFSVSSTVTATVVPEPASLVMMLTGMPLPLVVLGLLRRRRAAA